MRDASFADIRLPAAILTDDDVSDSSDGVEAIIPPKKTKAAPAKKAGKQQVKPAVEEIDDADLAQDRSGAEESEDDDDEDEDEYAVEKILSHEFDQDVSLC